MDSLKEYLSNHPQEFNDWLDNFPWDHFDAEITIHEDMEETLVIAKKAILQKDAEITRLLICQEAEIGQGAEILGTMVCNKALIGEGAECNYLIARIATLGKDAEVRSAIVLDSLKLETGAEVDELEILDSTFLDVHDESLIKGRKLLSEHEFQEAITQRLQLVLESAIK